MPFYINNVCFAENLAPSELKKLRNKQRKARRKAEKAQAVAVAEKREQHKSRQADTETEGPVQDELVPDKLAKVLFVLLHFKTVLTTFFSYIFTENSRGVSHTVNGCSEGSFVFGCAVSGT